MPAGTRASTRQPPTLVWVIFEAKGGAPSFLGLERPAGPGAKGSAAARDQWVVTQASLGLSSPSNSHGGF